MAGFLSTVACVEAIAFLLGVRHSRPAQSVMAKSAKKRDAESAKDAEMR